MKKFDVQLIMKIGELHWITDIYVDTPEQAIEEAAYLVPGSESVQYVEWTVINGKWVQS